MSWRTILLLAVLLMAARIAPAPAASPYFALDGLVAARLLPPPPTPGSAAEQADLQAVVSAQQAASPDRVRQAQGEGKENVFTMFTPVLGKDFTPKNLPLTAGLFAQIDATEDLVVGGARAVFARQRPCAAAAGRVKALIQPPQSFGYPASQATAATAMTIVMADILPEKKAALWARSRDYAESRVILGMNYPSDIAAGVSTGTAMAQALFNDPRFAWELEAVRKEIRQAATD